MHINISELSDEERRLAPGLMLAVLQYLQQNAGEDLLRNLSNHQSWSNHIYAEQFTEKLTGKVLQASVEYLQLAEATPRLTTFATQLTKDISDFNQIFYDCLDLIKMGHTVQTAQSELMQTLHDNRDANAKLDQHQLNLHLRTFDAAFSIINEHGTELSRLAYIELALRAEYLQPKETLGTPEEDNKRRKRW